MNSAAALLLTLLAAGGEAGHGEAVGHHGPPSFGEFLLEQLPMFLNFALFFGFLIWKLRPMLSNALVNRRASMADQLEEAKRKQAEAEAKAAEFAKKLENLEQEVHRIVQSYEAQAEADVERMREETEKAIQRLARDNENSIKQEVLKAEQAIRESAVTATLQAAERLVKQRINNDDQRRLAEQYVTQLDAENASRA